MRTKKSELQTIPVLPLRDVVVFPYMVMPLFVGRPRSIHSLDEAMNHGKQLLLVSQKQPELEEPGVDDLYDVGTILFFIALFFDRGADFVAVHDFFHGNRGNEIAFLVAFQKAVSLVRTFHRAFHTFFAVMNLLFELCE